ncbi:MAG: enoyl-CoA hydratase/isomerase family protein, partial [Aridibacter sp.]
MSEQKPLDIEIINKCAVVRFIRPEKKNPLSVETLEILDENFAELNSNKKIKIIIFTGSGNTFAAGAHLNEVAELNEKTAIDFGLLGQNLMQKIYHSNKMTIAAIDGFCMGGALDLALSCNVRIASERAVFAHPGA